MSDSPMQDHPSFDAASFNAAAVYAGTVASADMDVAPEPATSETPKDIALHQRDELRTHFRMLLSRISNVAKSLGRPLQTIGITSCCRGEGVSAVTAGLAFEAARNQRVLFIDANCVNPSAHRIFGLSSETGLLQANNGDSRADQRVQSSSHSNLSVVVAGVPEDVNGDAHISANKFDEFITAVRNDFDLVFVDLPAVNSGGDTIDLAGLLDGIVLVVQAERVPWQLAQKTQAILQEAGAQLLGVAINQAPTRIPQWFDGEH